MNNNTEIKKSLSKTLTLRLALLMLAVLAVIAAFSYGFISHEMNTQNLQYSRTLADMLLDSICSFTENRNEPVDQRYTDTIDAISREICDKNYAAFVYTYKVSADQKHITLLSAAERPAAHFIETIPPEHFGKEIEYTPDKEEKELWEHKRDYVYYKEAPVNNSVTAICCRDDSFGNIIVVGVGVSRIAVKNDIAAIFIKVALIVIAALLILTVFTYFLIRDKVLVPAKRISDFISTFITNGQRTGKKLNESGDDEFALIASSFNKMTDDIDQYMDNIRQLTGAQERHKAELDIAGQIQQGFLPLNNYYEKECQIFAKMTPARNIGGDLYDYLMLDDGRILITIADVSGKGIAASMYMSVILVIMHQLALSGNNPAAIMRETNNIVSRSNKNMFFATAFVGIYDPAAREFTYSNAGHLPPYVIRNKPELLETSGNLVLGLFEDEEYTEEKITLGYGDTVFLYTDGVTEAINENKEFFGADKLKDTLETFRSSHEENIVEYVYRAVERFMNGAERFDDITMLSFTAKNHTGLELEPDKNEFSKIKQVILASELPRQLQLSLCVAAEEIFINICKYAFAGRTDDPENKISFIFEHSDRIYMRFEDNGMAYDPTAEVDYDIDYDPDENLGGLGKIIAFTIADEVKYEYNDNKNILTITKYLMEG